jgi:hypothetical protein
MDKDQKEKSNLGNDKDLKNTETNPVTGVKTGEPRSDKAGTTENQNANDRSDKSRTATGGSKE